MNFVPKNPVEAVLAEILAAIEQPAWVIDVDRGVIVAANGRGDAVWGVPMMVPALDGAAMATFEALRTRLGVRVGSRQPRGVALSSVRTSIPFRTCAGARMQPCLAQRLDDRAGSAALLVIAEERSEVAPLPSERDGSKEVATFVERWLSSGGAARNVVAPRVTPPVDGSAGAPLNDAETLREIARRIRQGATGFSGQSLGGDDEPSPQVAGGAVRDSAAIDISAHLAHEIRTPLAAIISLAEVITEERLGPWPNERYRTYIADILDSARHGLEVVDGILREVPSEVRLTPIATAEVDLNVEVEALCASLQPLAGKSGATLEAALVSGLPRVAADRRNVRQMLLNLISNAIKHGGAAVRIKVTTGYELGGEVWVEVEDDGPGMAGSVTGDSASAVRGSKGDAGPRSAGLGLRLTRSLATANGAHLELSSRPQRGVRARIVFDVCVGGGEG